MKNSDSTLLSQFLPADYSDTYEREISNKKEFSSEELFRLLFSGLPSWIDNLMKLRNILVTPLGLKNDRFEAHLSEMIRCRNEREIVWGMNDKHLCFYASVWCTTKEGETQRIGITTFVKYNNRIGKIYFFAIKPFHKIIIKSLLKRIGKAH